MTHFAYYVGAHAIHVNTSHHIDHGHIIIIIRKNSHQHWAIVCFFFLLVQKKNTKISR